MPVSIPNPYTGDNDETCSVSFQAQQAMAAGVSSPQTEAEYNKSKLLGEWGVIKGKIAKGDIPNGTKVLTYANTATNSRGYLYVKGGALHKRTYFSDGKQTDGQVNPGVGDNMINSSIAQVSIPQSVSPKPKPEPVPLTAQYIEDVADDPDLLHGKEVVAVNAAGDYITYDKVEDKFKTFTQSPDGYGYVEKDSSFSLKKQTKGGEWFHPDGKDTTPKHSPATTVPPPSSAQVAAPTPTTPVNSGSDSPGSMSHEDVAALFVKVKDDLAKEKGLNIKGANPTLDEEVYKAIGNGTGYTPAEVKAKIDAYKAAGNKLSALKKKVQAGTKQVPALKPAQRPTSGPKPLVPDAGTGKPDPKPNGVPTVATPTLANTIKNEVKETAEADPAKVYSDEDVAAAYIIAKDKVVAGSGGKWTLYTKNDEMDLEIAIQVGLKTGLNPTQQKEAIANYLASGKKLSVLKKQLAKQGAFKPEADTLKKTKAEKTQEEKAAEVAAKADEGYTPTPTPATGNPPVDTAKPATKSEEKKAQNAGDISGIPDSFKKDLYANFKAQGSKAYLSSGNESTYEAILTVQVNMKAKGQDLTLLQILRVIDEQGAIKFNADNQKLFEKKTATWLTTPEAATFLKKQEAELAKKAEQAKLKAEAEKKAKEMEANQPPLPADSTQYQGWSLDKAAKVSKTWLDRDPWTDRQRRDLTYYTGGSYYEMNNHLRRGAHADERSKNAIVGAKAGMRPTTEAILVKRGTGLDQFETLGISNQDGHLMWTITGKTFTDPGFLSTSAGGRAAFSGKPAILEVECPVGTPMAYVAPISNYPHENEMLLQAGLEYKVLNVRKEGGQFVVRMRVVNWPGKAN